MNHDQLRDTIIRLADSLTDPAAFETLGVVPTLGNRTIVSYPPYQPPGHEAWRAVQLRAAAEHIKKEFEIDFEYDVVETLDGNAFLQLGPFKMLEESA